MIACIGWGSPIWDKGSLDVDRRWLTVPRCQSSLLGNRARLISTFSSGGKAWNLPILRGLQKNRFILLKEWRLTLVPVLS
jgi:hypothetical protein